VEKLAAYLGCTVSELIGESPSPGKGGPASAVGSAGREYLTRPAGSEAADEGITVPEDPVIEEIMSRVRDLTPDQQRLYLAQLRALEAEDKKK